MYTCGPTVYDHIHVGNLSSFIYADTLRRALILEGFQVKHVMNYTDVDDKTIRRSQEQFPSEEPDVALRNLTQKYEEVFVRDMQRIGNETDALHFVRATEQIDEMKQLISKLYKAGFAYVTDDGIYFSINAYRYSGKKYGQLLEITDSNTSEARIANDEYDKDFIHDFALWKKRRGNEPAWNFEIDDHNLLGRPGWHIECSAMSRNLLGQPFDIHTGGVDLIFPHHENEIAQSTAGEDNPVFATTFFHNEHLLIDGKKMSKSLNNFYTLEDIKKRGYDPTAFRMMVLQSHYRSQSNFTWEILEAAKNRLKTYERLADLQFQADDEIGSSLGNDYFEKLTSGIHAALAHDLNTPEVLSIISQAADHIFTYAKTINPVNESEFEVFLQILDTVLGLNLSKRQDISVEQRKLMWQEREAARKAKDWKKSDEIRDILEEQGIAINDTPAGPVWYRI